MKNLMTVLPILLILSIKSYAQDKITVLINGSEIFIETYKDILKPFGLSSDELSLDDAYRLGPSAVSSLKQGIRTAIKWIDLNKTHKKSFEKEVCRFKAMDKEKYKSFGYQDGWTEEMTLLFKGKSDGSFELIIFPYNSSIRTFIKFTDKVMIMKFKDLLDGKSANEEIDDIFKN